MITNTVVDLPTAFLYLFMARPELVWFMAAIFVIEFIVITKLNHLTWTRVIGNLMMISLIMGSFQIGRWLIVGDLLVTLPQGYVLSAWLIMFTINLMACVLVAKIVMESTRPSRIAFYKWLAKLGNSLYAKSTERAMILEKKHGKDKNTVAERKAEAIAQVKALGILDTRH